MRTKDKPEYNYRFEFKPSINIDNNKLESFNCKAVSERNARKKFLKHLVSIYSVTKTERKDED